MLDNTANQKELLGVLAGSTDHAKLLGLAQQAGEFVGFYAQLTARLTAAAEDCDKEENDSPSDHFNRGRIGGNGNEHIAQQVVHFLQELSVRFRDA